MALLESTVVIRIYGNNYLQTLVTTIVNLARRWMDGIHYNVAILWIYIMVTRRQTAQFRL
jgi:uncharacterized membrane protein